jgi:two-component system, NtrC family, sensor kinase
VSVVDPTGTGDRIGERVARLPWFWPDASSLSAFLDADRAESPPVQGDPGHDDPGMALLLMKEPWIERRRLLAHAIDRLQQTGSPWIDWREPSVVPIYRTALAAAHFARILAEQTEKLHPDFAWGAAWLPFAAWLGMAAESPQAIVDCLTHTAISRDPVGAQLRTWGLSRSDLSAKLAAHWPVPEAAKILLSRIDLSPAEAKRHCGDPDLLAIIQLATWLAEHSQSKLGLTYEFVPELAAEHLEFHAGDIAEVRRRFVEEVDLSRLFQRDWIDPRGRQSLLQSVTVNASPTLRLHHPVEIVETEAPVEMNSEEIRIRDAKLVALAEFAAGASHEINTPLAVISGHCQRMLKKETDSAARAALETMIRQANKIHSVMADLMQFARPGRPDLRPVELRRLLEDCVEHLSAEATARGISIDFIEHSAPLWVSGDARQLRTAVKSLIRNSIEATPDDGWVSVKTQFHSDTIDILVEDSGPGPDEESRTHLFDPFFSGRQANRGRGLGLPTAWRLAREHGGNVVYVPLPGGPTRFVFKLPAASAQSVADRLTA